MSTRTSDDASARSNPLPEGTLAVGAGLLLAGLSAYGFLSVAKHAVGEDPFASLSLLWFLTFIAAPGFFLPVEQEVGRALAHRRALGQGSLPVVRKAAVLAASLLVVLIVLVLVLSPVITDELLHGTWSLLLGLVIALAGYAAAHFTRGVLSGSGEFSRYGLLMGADGVIRVAACIVLAVAGVHAVGIYGLCVGIPPFLAVLIAARGKRGILHDGPETTWAELAPNLGWLLAGSVLAATLVNAGPVAAALLATDAEKGLVSRFNSGVLIARVPLFLFQAVQAALLPKLASLAAQGALDEFRSGFRKLLAAVVAVGVLGTVGAAVLGPWALSTFFDADLGRRTLTLLALSSAIYMGAVALAQALIALHGHARVALGWAIGLATMVAVTAVATSDLLLRVELGLLAGSAAAAASFAVALMAALRRGAEPDADSIIEAIYDLPVEP